MVIVVIKIYLYIELMVMIRYETSAKLDKCITEAAKHLIDTILELEVLKSSEEEYEIDYTSSAGSSIVTLNDPSYQRNKIDSSSRCCS